SDFRRAALPRVENGGEDDDPGDREAGLGAAGGGDDAGREPAAAGPALPGTGSGFRQPEYGIPPDAGTNWEAGGCVARAGIELSALAETAVRSASGVAQGRSDVQSCAAAALLERWRPDFESGQSSDRKEDVGGAAYRDADGHQCPVGHLVRAATERSAVGGSECASRTALVRGGAGNAGADSRPQGERQDHNRVWDAGGF